MYIVKYKDRITYLSYSIKKNVKMIAIIIIIIIIMMITKIIIIIIIMVLLLGFLYLILSFFGFYLFIPAKNANQCMHNYFSIKR